MPGLFAEKDRKSASMPVSRQNDFSHGKMMPAVPALQKKSTEEELPAQGKFAIQKKGEEEELPAQGKFAIQKKGEEEELPAQGKFAIQKKGEEEELPAQMKSGLEEEEPAQMKGGPEENEPVQSKFVVQKKTNNTGLPDNLKAGVESLSGMNMSDVKVHYNSSQPAQLNALAYAQGTDIHVAPGQERHLPHEAWHIVQQKQGRVQATRQMKDSVPVNDDKSLEKEADVMGAKANTAQLKSVSDTVTVQMLRLPPGLYPQAHQLEWTVAATKHGHTQEEIIAQIAAGWAAGSDEGAQVTIPWGVGAPAGIILIKLGDGQYRVIHAQSAENKAQDEAKKQAELAERAKVGDTADTSSNWRKQTS